jgi:hypothetical protein
MGKLDKYTLFLNKEKNRWELEDNKTNQVIRSFDTKSEATAGGVLRETLGTGGGSVRIKKENGRFQEERTYPLNQDPKQSKG